MTNQATPSAPAKLLAWRKAQAEGKGISQESAAALMRKPVSQNTWSDWEHGNKPPQIGNALDIERITDGAVKVSDWIVPFDVVERRPMRRRIAAGAR